jgi:ribosomal protein S18 acetylase RimI-like enzyme
MNRDLEFLITRFFILSITFYFCGLGASCLAPSLANASYEFTTRSGKTGVVEQVKNIDQIDTVLSRKILINSFINEYRAYMEPQDIDLDTDLRFWLSSEGEPSVESYYSRYFDSEFEEFKKGHLIWVQAKLDGNLVGWATFEQESKHALYMNLLIVDPSSQKLGIGGQLATAVARKGFVPEIKTINLLLRKKNKGGHIFYSRLGFRQNLNYQRPENFVDTSLLEGWTLDLNI